MYVVLNATTLSHMIALNKGEEKERYTNVF